MKLCISNVTILTPLGSQGVANDKAPFLEIKNGALCAVDGKITYVGTDIDLDLEGFQVIDGGGRVLTPGLIDSHTHAVFGGWRYNELPLKLAGTPYLEILKQGGGILSTVEATRSATQKELTDKTADALDNMMSLGVTTIEAKSGYGLNLETEIKQLLVAKELNDTHAMDIVSTFMGGHAVPKEYAGKSSDYVDLVCDVMIPAIATEKLAEFNDVFCEDSVFTVAEARKILETGKKYGLTPKIHADEIKALGASLLAGEVGAISGEHLIAIDEAGIRALADNNVIAILLPATSFYLDAGYAPARKMMNQHIPIAIATDYNPGSCPSLNLQLAMNIAYLRYKMTPKEILCGVSLNAAAGINRGDSIGTLEVGKYADMVLWDMDDINMLFYRFGQNQVHTLIKKGTIISQKTKSL